MQKELENQLFTAWGKFDFDPSHARPHVEKVLNHALYLNSIYHADEEVVVASAILHDLGRSNRNFHGELSKHESVRLAKPILEEIGFSQSKADRVCKAIEDHDQTAPARTIEGKILKDADFLSGLGVEGVIRIIIWTIESGGSLTDIIHRLKVKMPERIAALELPESKEIARGLHTQIETFLGKIPDFGNELQG